MKHELLQFLMIMSMDFQSTQFLCQTSTLKECEAFFYRMCMPNCGRHPGANYEERHKDTSFWYTRGPSFGARAWSDSRQETLEASTPSRASGASLPAPRAPGVPCNQPLPQHPCPALLGTASHAWAGGRCTSIGLALGRMPSLCGDSRANQIPASPGLPS